MNRKLKYIFFGIVVLALASLIAMDHLMNRYFYQPALQNSFRNFESVRPKIVEDLKILDQQNLFPEYGFQNNAEELFEKHISWVGAGIVPLDDPNLKMANAFIAKYKMWHKDPKQLQAMLKDKDLTRIDVSWLDRVQEFDHWDVSLNSHNEDQLKKSLGADTISRIGIFASLPIPEYSDVKSSVVVRFLQLYKENRAQEALKMFRKTNELIYSNGYLVSAMVSVNYFNYERYLVETLKIKNWSTVSAEIAKVFKRVSWAWVGILKSTVSQEISPEILEFAKVKNGICAASTEGIFNTALDQDFFDRRILFESDHSASLERVNRVNRMVLGKCRLERLILFAQRSPASARQLFFNLENQWNNSFDFDLIAVQLPYFRRLYGYKFSALKADYLKQYNLK